MKPEAIDNYLRQSSDVVKKRVENTLKASRIVAANAVRRRNARSADQVVKDSDAQEITFATDSSDKIRAKKHIDPPPGNLNNAMTWEGSGTHDDTETDPTSIGDSANLTFSEDLLEGSGDETTSNEDAKAPNDDLDFLVSYFLRDEPVDDMTKDAIKDMLKFRKTFVTPSGLRQRVTVAKTTPPRPTTFGPELDDFTELVYASGTQRQPEEAEVAPPATRAPAPPPPSTVEPTPDPYTQSACDYWEELRSPFYAMNTHSEWKTLINMPNYETYIHMEHCKEDKSQGRCAEGCRCTQKFTIRNMPVYDRDINGCDVIYMDEFLFPSHCDCKCLPPGYTLFQRPPEPTTPLPEVAEFSESVPEGWLPERPTTGRYGQKEKEEEEEEKEVVREEVIEVEEADGEEEVVVVEVVEREKGEEKPVTSVGSPEKLKSDSPPSV
ncbi:Protein spaetzle 4 [Amphibalanus amphitrite]|uniref:Protein spaetzle 4 n=1 Tax=Amphibalanus amphitrite TaxID=1232801 RepID=A0A6A4XB40_AMPAM|nr:Protein spaetzle 4 [Amphibalanus amphitrite]